MPWTAPGLSARSVPLISAACRRHGTDLLQTQFALHRVVCLIGTSATELFYGRLWLVLAGYILLNKRAGARLSGGAQLALTVTFAALISLPFGVGVDGASLLLPTALLTGLGVAVVSALLPYSLDLAALRRMRARLHPHPAHARGRSVRLRRIASVNPMRAGYPRCQQICARTRVACDGEEVLMQARAAIPAR